MKKKTLLFLTCWLFFCLLYGQQQEHWSPEQIAKIKTITAVQVSPDGSKVAYAVRSALMTDDRSEYINQIFVSDTDGSNSIQLTQGDNNNTNPKWSPDGKYLAFISNRDGRNNLYIMPAAGGDAERLTTVKTSIGIFDWSPNGQMIAYTMVDSFSVAEQKASKGKDDSYFMDENYKQTRLYIISLEKDSAGIRKTVQLTKENRSVISFNWSPDNRWIAYSHAESPKYNLLFDSDISKVNVETGEVRTLLATKAIANNPFFSPDGKWVAYETSDGPLIAGGRIFAQVVSSNGGKSLALAPTPNEAVSLIGWSAEGRSLILGEAYRTLFKIYKLGIDEKTIAEWKMSNTEYPSMITMNKTGSHFGLVLQSLSKPGDVYVTATASYQPARISNVNQEISSLPLPKTELISWKATNGMTIEALLTYPLSFNQDKKYPLLLQIVGGPAGHFPQIFIAGNSGSIGLAMYPIPVFAQKGYLVLRVNPRGSNGYGEAFRRTIDRNWGGPDYEDLMSAVDQVIQIGIVDTTKMGVMGWSYGGVMSSWIISHTNRFQAACIGANPSDLAALTLSSDMDLMPTYMKKQPWEDWEIYRIQSTLQYVDKIHTPVLLQHCEGDQRVPIMNAVIFFNALKRSKAPVRFQVFPRQAHAPNEPKMIVKAMQTNVAWMDHYLLSKDLGF